MLQYFWPIFTISMKEILCSTLKVEAAQNFSIQNHLKTKKKKNLKHKQPDHFCRPWLWLKCPNLVKV